MIRRRSAVLVVGLALAAGALAARHVPDAYAQENGERKRDEKKEKSPEEKELEAIGKEFADADAAALVARIPDDADEGKKGKVRIRAGKNDGTFTRVQAKKVLEEWFEKRTITKVKLKSTKELVGTYVLKWRKRQKTDEVDATLTIRIARDGDDGFVLKEIEVRAE